MKITSNNTATQSGCLLGKPASPKVAYVREHPTLKSLSGTHTVKPGGLFGVSRRLYSIRLVLSDAQRATLVSEAKKDGYHGGGFPSTSKFTRSLPMVSFPFTKQVDVASDLKVKRPKTAVNDQGTDTPAQSVPSGEFEVKNLTSTREKMRFPGTNAVMNVYVSEQYETTLKNPASTQLKPALTTPKHVGTVGSFELADRYVIHRQLEPKPGSMQKIKRFFGFGSAANAAAGPEPKRKLLILAHGDEPEFDKIDSHTGEPISKDFALPKNMTLSHGAPSAKEVVFITSLDSDARFKTMSDVVKEMPAFSRQRMSGSTHVIEFAGPVIARTDITHVNSVAMPVDASNLFEMATGLTPITGHGRAKNQMLRPVENFQPESAADDTINRGWNNAQQRGTITHDAVAFAAMERTDKNERVDILTIKPGQEGNLSDLIKQLKDRGIKYDEINSQACRSQNQISQMLLGTPYSIHDDGSSTQWPATNNVHPVANAALQSTSSTVVKFDKSDMRPRIDVASPVHHSQLKNATADESETDPVAFLGSANISWEAKEVLRGPTNSLSKKLTASESAVDPIEHPDASSHPSGSTKPVTTPHDFDLIKFLGPENISTELNDFLK